MRFTLNNYTAAEVNQIRKAMEEDFQYGVFGYELAPGTGTPHLQGYMHFKNPRAPSGVNKIPGFGRAALFFCDKSEQANIKYCKKKESKDPSKPVPWEEFHPENADLPDQNPNKQHLRDVAMKIRHDGPKAMAGIIDEHPEMYVRHHRGFQALATAVAPKRHLSAPPKCVYAFGPPGSGKSTFIHELAEAESTATGESIYYWGANWPWGDGYCDEKIIVIDDIRDRDFKGCAIPVAFMTKMIDRFPHMIQTKGGHVQFQGTSFYMSSVMHPADMWNKDVNDPVTQFLRRITDLWICEKDAAGDYQRQRLGDGLTPRVIAHLPGGAGGP